MLDMVCRCIMVKLALVLSANRWAMAVGDFGALESEAFAISMVQLRATVQGDPEAAEDDAIAEAIVDDEPKAPEEKALDPYTEEVVEKSTEQVGDGYVLYEGHCATMGQADIDDGQKLLGSVSQLACQLACNDDSACLAYQYSPATELPASRPELCFLHTDVSVIRGTGHGSAICRVKREKAAAGPGGGHTFDYTADGFALVTASIGGTWQLGSMVSEPLETAFTSDCKTRPTTGSDLDKVRGQLYWTCQDNHAGTVYRSSTNQARRRRSMEVETEALVTGVKRPGGVCVDADEEYFFYGQLEPPAIFRASLSGESKAVITNMSMVACEVVDDSVYIVNGMDESIAVMNVDGGHSVLYLFGNKTSGTSYPSTSSESGTVTSSGSGGTLRDLVMVDKTLYVTDDKLNRVYKIFWGPDTDEDGLPVIHKEVEIEGIPAPAAIEYSKALHALVITSEQAQAIYSYSLIGKEMSQLYSGAAYGAVTLCQNPCPLAPRQYG